MQTKDNQEVIQRWKYDSIKDHKEKSSVGSGVIYMLIKWYTYEDKKWELMEVIKKDNPVKLSKYSVEKGQIDKTHCMWAKGYTRNTNTLHVMYCNLLKTKRKVKREKFQFGIRVPRWEKVYKFDKINSNNLCTKALEKEVILLRNYFECFRLSEPWR